METLEQAARRELLEETGLRANAYLPLREIHIDGSSAGHLVDYFLTVFGAAYADGEAIADDDAETAAFYTLSQMTGLPLADSVFEVANELLEAAQNAGGSQPRALRTTNCFATKTYEPHFAFLRRMPCPQLGCWRASGARCGRAIRAWADATGGGAWLAAFPA